MKKAMLFFVISFSVLTIYGQKRSFDERVQYQTGNKDGKDLTIDLEVIYDTHLGDPIYKESAKVISEGDFVMFNGGKYFKNDIGQVVFDKVSTGLLNIQYDIYQGSNRVSTMRRNNVYTSKGLVPYGFFWRTLWPGVSSEDAKNIYKEGFTIRNVKIYNVKFNMYPLKDLLAKRKREEEAKKREEERLRIEAENKRIEEERIEAENKKIEEERLRVEEEKRKEREEKLEELEKDAIKIQEEKEKANKERFRIEKEALEKKFELEKEQREKQALIDAKEAADNAAIRRRLAKRREEEAARKKAAFNKSVKKVEKQLGDAFSAGLSSLIDGEGTLKFVYGIRNIEGDSQPVRSPLGASTLEIGAGLGKIGLSVGYSLLDSQNDLNTDSDNRRERSFGGTWAFGLDLTIFKFKFLNSGADFGLNGEYGFGNLDFKVSTSTNDWSTEYSTNFYGIGAQLRFLNFLYVSYGYGKFTTKESRISSSGSSDLDTVNGFYTKLGFGVKYDFGY